MSGLIAPIFLSLVAATLQPSDLVGEEHTHDWELIEHEVKQREEAIWLDRTMTPAYVAGDGEFKTVLMRGAEKEPTGSPFVVDILVAVDCDTPALAMVAVATPDLNGFPADDENPRLGKFEPPRQNERDKKVQTAIFKHICGPQWSYIRPQ
ncbi:MAG: hypothetical protein ABJ205_10985 [Erythrobacter sp.]|uniref:hypothetical protein n=1 Tax=Erythrobacter sp. TaxID=1042 RepID=UPI003262E628